jgi:RNA polymerase sigma-70 factor (ECF subfamily)
MNAGVYTQADPDRRSVAPAAPMVDVPPELIAASYERLRRIAERRLSTESKSHTLQPTSLVHESLLRVLRSRQIQVADVDELCGLMATVMRRVLVDHARTRRARIAREQEISHGSSREDADHNPCATVLDIHDLVSKLERSSPKRARAVELHYFGGLSTGAVARLLDCSQRWVQLELALARRALASHWHGTPARSTGP